jgi:hypothetical protein
MIVPLAEAVPGRSLERIEYTVHRIRGVAPWHLKKAGNNEAAADPYE